MANSHPCPDASAGFSCRGDKVMMMDPSVGVNLHALDTKLSTTCGTGWIGDDHEVGRDIDLLEFLFCRAADTLCARTIVKHSE